MTKTIWKFDVPLTGDYFNIDMPDGAEVLCVQMQNGAPRLWAKVDPFQKPTRRDFRVAGTGHPLEEGSYVGDGLQYVGTFQLDGGALVFHLFEVIV